MDTREATSEPRRNGLRYEYGVDEHGHDYTTVRGTDYDAVASAALEEKNCRPVARCPEVGEIRRDLENGCWAARVTCRRKE